MFQFELFTNKCFFQLQTSGTTLHTSPRDFLDPRAATNYFCQPPDQLETLENGMKLKEIKISTPSWGAQGAQIFLRVSLDVYFAVLKYF